MNLEVQRQEPINHEVHNGHVDIIKFPADFIDTSWMTKLQKKYYEILKVPENRQKKFYEIHKMAGFSKTAWYKAIKDNRFGDLMHSMGVKYTRYSDAAANNYEVEYIKNPKEKEEILNSDYWDLRKLFEVYPRHCSPHSYILDFNRISNMYLRQSVKRYFRNMLAHWKPLSFHGNLKNIILFMKAIHSTFPDIKSFYQLDRTEHIEKILQNMGSTNHMKRRSLFSVGSMFRYMYANKWKDGPSSESLLIPYDVPKYKKPLPRPIPPFIVIQLDDYIRNTVVPLLEQQRTTSIMDPQYWDMIIVIRYTGRRFEDVAHLIGDGGNTDCLRYDFDGDPELYVDHRISKMDNDLVIPLAHLNSETSYGNIVERAILRQKERVKCMPPAPDGYKYLFREYIEKDIVDTITYERFNNTVLSWMCRGVPLKNMDGSIYKVTAHQFRHTVATEMIDAGVDIYAVKEFLGHTSIAMTECYIKVYQQRLKREFEQKLSVSYATAIKSSFPKQDVPPDTQWIKNNLIGIFELGNGCCEYPYRTPSCPHMACRTCIRRKVYPRHLGVVKQILESEAIHKENALQLGLLEKVKESEHTIAFYTAALNIISKGEIFDASRDYVIRS